jgi:hypothetical protein
MSPGKLSELTPGSQTIFVSGVQTIQLAIERDEDLPELAKWIRIAVRYNDTVRKIAGRRGHPEAAKEIAKKNKIRSVKQNLRRRRKDKPRGMSRAKWNKILKKNRRRILVPGNLRSGTALRVLAGDEPPKVVGGYAKFDTVDRPERIGLTRFRGYDPLTVEVPIRFEAWAARERFASGVKTEDRPGAVIERQILLLERMAGRGDSYGGAGLGPPPILRLSSLDSQGKVVPLVSSLLQWTDKSNAPLWRIIDLSWDDGAIRSSSGQRVRQTATVTLQEHKRLKLAHRSATRRAADKPKLTGAEKKRIAKLKKKLKRGGLTTAERRRLRKLREQLAGT